MKRANFLDALQELTTGTREKVAAEVFDVAAVQLKLTTAATNGDNECVIGPPRAINLGATKAATALVETLKRKGLRVEWSKRRWVDGGPEIPELIVTW